MADTKTDTKAAPGAGTPAPAPATASAPPAPKHVVRNLTTDDEFLLKDTNGDGYVDTVVIVLHDWEKEQKELAEKAKYADYFRGIASARKAAGDANQGKSAVEVTAAENVAEAEFKKNFKGATPPPSEADKAKEEAEKKAAEVKKATEEEVAKLKSK